MQASNFPAVKGRFLYARRCGEPTSFFFSPLVSCQVYINTSRRARFEALRRASFCCTAVEYFEPVMIVAQLLQGAHLLPSQDIFSEKIKKYRRKREE